MLFNGCLLLGMAYGLFTLFLWRSWKKIPDYKLSGNQISSESTKVSILIPVRNEAENILALLQDLNNQSYPFHLFEVWVINDASTDQTAQLVQDFISQARFSLHLENLIEEPTLSPKKRAITHTIPKTIGTLILCTDGDCRVGAEWVATIVSFYEQTNARFISAPVTFLAVETFKDNLFTIEFGSLVGAGGATLAHNRPTMCNGANIAYQKTAFEAVGGYAATPKIASGDDEFLMHKIHEKLGGVHFLKSQAATVETAAPASWKFFVQQRKRWASKWKHYSQWPPKLIAIFVFLANAMLLLSLLLWGFGVFDRYQVQLLWLLKCLPEWLYLGNLLHFFKRKNLYWYIPLLQLVYPFYVCFFGLLAQKPQYQWKNRSLE
ncbi:glycosyltransferase [Arundinibacter roseus]|uniref:Glycosyltransferase n=1 Tax=Arundinibacter roseus TaxID=2070510 RepID=A0A4R4KCL4_9BACT|nr:glycosyltransferase [Arundinibacter roseus]TDB64446.1 glycosyltransferase [Arundinibacter roseus]